jgi:hypothetical protein
MKRSLSQVLADSHIAAVTIAVLLLWSLDGTFRALWIPVSRAVGFLFTAVAIFDIPYFSPTLTFADRLMLISTFYFLYSAIVSLLAAWLLSRWVYGVGPIRSLVVCRSKLAGREHA